MVDLNGHEAGNGGHSQRKPTAHRVSSTRKLVLMGCFASCALKREGGRILAGTPFLRHPECGYEQQVFKDAANCDDG